MAVILMCMCDGQMLYNGVGVVSEGSGMRLNGKYWNSTRLSSLVLLSCTALMRANSPKHPPGCLQFAKMGKEKGVDGKWKTLGRSVGKDRERVCLCVCALRMTPGGWRIEYATTEGLFMSYREKTPCTTDIQNIQYADDLTLVAESASKLQAMVSPLDRACTQWGMTINATKTKTMTVGEEDENEATITLRGEPIRSCGVFLLSRK